MSDGWVYSVSDVQTELRQLKNRLSAIERGPLLRSIIALSDGSIHIPGGVSVGGGSETGGGGQGVRIVAGGPADPTGLVATGGASENQVYIDLTWDEPTDRSVPILHYDVRWKLDGDADTEYRYTTTQASDIRLIVPNDESGLTFDVGVRAVGTNGQPSAWVTDTVAAGTDADAPDPVTGLVVADDGNTTQMGYWNPLTELDLDYYQVQVDDTDNTFASLVYDERIKGTVVTVDSLDGTGVTYWWRVRGVDRAGNTGSWSTAVEATTTLIPDAHIVELTATKIRTGTIGSDYINLNTTSGYIRSNNYNGSTVDPSGTPGTTGFIISGNGEMVMNEGIFRAAITAGTMDIGSGFHVDNSGNVWWGASATYADATHKISNDGLASLTSGTFATGTSGDYMEITGQAINVYDTSSKVADIVFDSSLTKFRSGSADAWLALSDSVFGLYALDATPPYIEIQTLNSALVLSGAPPNHQGAGTINVVTQNADQNFLHGTGNVYHHGDGFTQWEDSTGDPFAKLSAGTAGAGPGQLKLMSVHATEGGEIILDHGTGGSGSVEITLDNWYGTPSPTMGATQDHFRIVANSTVIFDMLTNGDGMRIGDSGGYGFVVYGRDTVTATDNWHVGSEGNGDFNFYNGNMGAGTRRMYVTSGGASYNTTGTRGTISDERLKQNIRAAPSFKSGLAALDVVNYELKPEAGGDGTDLLGFTAQQVEQHLPDLVEENNDGDKVVKTSLLIPMLVQAYQDLEARLVALGG